MIVYKMVYMSGSKAARNQASLVNRTNICGGPKKGGLAPSVGLFISSNPNLIGATNTQYGLVCRPNLTIQTQSYGYRATIGGNMG
jgi:copper homeostasis protein CutC